MRLGAKYGFNAVTLLLMIVIAVPLIPFNICIAREVPPYFGHIDIRLELAILWSSEVAVAYGLARVLNWLVVTYKVQHWFQIRLSTCLALMFWSAFLLWANIDANADTWNYGWPMFAAKMRRGEMIWKYPAMTWNIVFALVSLGGVGCACEWWMRVRLIQRPPGGSLVLDSSWLLMRAFAWVSP